MLPIDKVINHQRQAAAIAAWGDAADEDEVWLLSVMSYSALAVLNARSVAVAVLRYTEFLTLESPATHAQVSASTTKSDTNYSRQDVGNNNNGSIDADSHSRIATTSKQTVSLAVMRELLHLTCRNRLVRLSRLLLTRGSMTFLTWNDPIYCCP